MKSVFVFATVALLLLAGCGKKGSSADAVRFNDGLLASSKRVADAVLEDPRLSANDRRKRITPIANYIRTIDQGSSDGIKKAQAAFAKAHGFQLK